MVPIAHKYLTIVNSQRNSIAFSNNAQLSSGIASKHNLKKQLIIITINT
jgi:hypothetical protein